MRKFTEEDDRRAKIAFDANFKLISKVLKNPELTDKLPRKAVLVIRGNKLIVRSASSRKKAEFLKELLTKN